LRERKILVAALLVLGSAFVQPAASAPVLFDFEDQSFGADTPFSITNGLLTATFASPADPGAFGITSAFPLFTIMSGNILLSPGSAFVDSVPLVITFSQPVHSVSFQFGLGGVDPGGLIELTTNAGGSASVGGTVPIGSLLPQGTLFFEGDSFTVLTLSSNMLDFGIDNLSVDASVDPTPLPASLPLFATGLLALAAVRGRIMARA